MMGHMPDVLISFAFLTYADTSRERFQISCDRMKTFESIAGWTIDIMSSQDTRWPWQQIICQRLSVSTLGTLEE
jgi:hypothetical protein